MVRHSEPQAADDTDVVDYRHGTPWDLGLLPAVLRRIAACTRRTKRSAQATA